MKLSKYNHIFDSGEFTYWFNCLTRAFFRTSRGLGEKLQASISVLDDLAASYPDFVEKLKNGGFVVDDEFDEFGKAIELNKKNVENKNYSLTIIPTLNCNFKCHYCIQDHIPSLMKKDVVEKVFKHIEYMIREEKIESLNIEWFGGEPFMALETIVPEITFKAISMCEEYGIPFNDTATTNAYFLTPDKIELINKLRLSRLQITLDGPRDMHNKVKFQKNCESAFDHVLNNICSMLTEMPQMRIVLRVNYTKENFNLELVEHLDKAIPENLRNQIDVLLKKVWQEDFKQEDYLAVTQTAKKLLSIGFKVDQSDMIGGYVPCYVSQKYYNTINYNGLVHKCTACDDMYTGDNCGRISDSGEIVWDNGFDEKCTEPSYNNETCLSCKFLPACYGMCPRDYVKGLSYCKLKSGMDIETKVKNLVDFNYEHKMHTVGC